MKLAPISWLVAAACLAGCAQFADQPQPTYSITEMHAYPYYTEDGAIHHEVDLFSPYPMLIHSIVQQGDLDIPSQTTITIVEVGIGVDNAVNWSSSPTLEVRAIAHDSGRRVAVERVNLGEVLTPDRRRWVVPVMIYGTGCESLDVTARIILRSHPTNAISKQKIRAACFE